MSWILLVEDDDNLREVLEAAFILSGFDVRTARHGREALALLDEGDLPQLVITDLRMPVMDGVKLISLLREMARTRHLPIIVVSAEEVHLPGLQAHFKKPFEFEHLRLAAEQYVSV